MTWLHELLLASLSHILRVLIISTPQKGDLDAVDLRSPLFRGYQEGSDDGADAGKGGQGERESHEQRTGIAAGAGKAVQSGQHA